MKRTFAAAVFGLAFLATSAFAQFPNAKPLPEKSPLAGGFQSIQAKDCETWLNRIASKEFAGRKSGTPGYQKAADYMAQQFKSFGLKGAAENGSYFQQVPLVSYEWNNAKGKLKIGAKSWSGNDNLILGPATGTLVGQAALVEIAKVENRRLDDKALAQLKGRVVLLKGKSRAGVELSRQLEGAGARGVIREINISARTLRNFPRRIGRTRLDAGVDTFVTVYATSSLFEELVTAVKFGKNDANGHTQLAETQVTIKSGHLAKRVTAPNVVALLPGSDPKLAAECVIIGSHLDHLGTSKDRNGKTRIHYGADDDGSGSTAILAIARAFSKLDRAPKRSVLFLAVCAEEMGLLGSEYYVEHPLFPLAKTVCELQMDMVGRNEESKNETAAENERTTHVIGSKKHSMELHRLILAKNEFIGFQFEPDEEDRVYTRSDHYNFAKKGIPVAFLFSGFHPDYHKPTDTPDRINYGKLANAAKLYFLVAHQVADQTRRLKVDVGPFKTAK